MSSTTELLPQPLFTGRIDTRSPETIITSSPRTSSSTELIRIVSPRSSKSSNVGGIGLGMVVALDKFGSGTDIAKNTSVIKTNSNRSNPIPIGSAKSYMSMKGRSRASCIDNEQESSDLGCLDNCVTTTNTTMTTGTSTSRVLLYCDDDHEDDFLRQEIRNRLKKMGVYNESPQRSCNDTRRTAAVAAFPPLDFLSSCNLCRKKLHGRDIYMYRGEKAFCSTDCRYRQIIIDEHKEKYCVNEVVVSRSADISGSPAYLEDQIFSTGIMAI